MQPFERVHNHEALVERFGAWPSFHDAEVLSVRLDNGQRTDGRVAVELDVHIFEITGETDEYGYYVFRLHTLVTLRFDGACEIELEDFGPQNVLDGLELELADEPAVDAARLSVELPSNNGLSGALRCEEATVMAVKRFEPGPFSVYGQQAARPWLSVEGPSEADPAAVMHANADGVRDLVDLLREPLVPGRARSLGALPGQEAPAVGWLLLRETEGLVELRLVERELRIWGAREHLFAMAAHLEEFLAHADFDDPDTHTHLDHGWSRPLPWLAPTSLPLTVTARPS